MYGILKIIEVCICFLFKLAHKTRNESVFQHNFCVVINICFEICAGKDYRNTSYCQSVLSDNNKQQMVTGIFIQPCCVKF